MQNEELPAVSEARGSLPLDTGNWETDCANGRDAAQQLVAGMRGGGSPLALQNAARELASRTSFDGVAVGFYARLADHLI